MAALVVAGAGVPVCKHGARSASSKCGTADVLEALGVARADARRRGRMRRRGRHRLLLRARLPSRVQGSPAQPRRELGVPTVFNLLGPMANPGRVRRQLIGVAEVRFAEAMVEALRQHGLDLGLGRARGGARRAHDHRPVHGDRPARRLDRGIPGRPRRLRVRQGHRRRPAWWRSGGERRGGAPGVGRGNADRTATSCSSTPAPPSSWPASPPNSGRGSNRRPPRSTVAMPRPRSTRWCGFRSRMSSNDPAAVIGGGHSAGRAGRVVAR